MSLLSNPINEHVQPWVQKFSAKVQPIQRGASLSSKLLNRVPNKLQRRLLEPALNHALQLLVDEGELDFLADKTCGIAVKNTNQLWVLSLVDGQLKLLDQTHTDVTVSATVPAFLKLISKQADPDALFFQRELSIEGNVELGLHVKNMLDALDEDDLPEFWQTTLSHLRKLLILES
ncbi:SCP2 domain-containing protein [Reinekea sp.]|jgi:predicted lipid carrier protein YhbT|uniref:ubiquinone anaerobic biosynthesis accessory factor UbiT n=1 Tax=Reinekea sp. TaxID=1970455 RepID=UPI003988E452